MSHSFSLNYPSLWDNAGILSKITFYWTWILIGITSSPGFDGDHLPNLSVHDESKLIGEKVWNAWSSRKQPFSHVLAQVFSNYRWVGVLQLFVIALKMIQVSYLGKFIDAFDDGIDENAYWIATVLVLATFSKCMLDNHYFFQTGRIGIQVKAAFIYVLYRKSLSLHLSALSSQSVSSSRIINMASTDVAKFQEASMYLHFLWVAILESVIFAAYGCYLIGPSFLAGVALIVLLVPLQSYFSWLFGGYRQMIAEISDKRLKLTNQAISGVRLMKMSGWELLFKSAIVSEREKEISNIRSVGRLKGINEAICFVSCISAAYFSFITYHYVGGTMTTSIVFMVLFLFAILQLDVSMMLFHAVKTFNEALVACERMDEFLMQPNVSKYDAIDDDQAETYYKSETKSADVDCNVVISLNRLCASWQHKPTLTNIDLKINKGELIVVIGSVGSSKSSLLCAILGELSSAEANSRSVNGSIAYACQEPWIMSDTVKSNILFGNNYKQDRYQSIIDSCQLKQDMTVLMKGDETVVGDNGVNLSGGQKARIGLARLVYANADICLLDDPLSAVDPSVSKRLFCDVICNPDMIGGKTRILVTHQLQYLSDANISRIIVLSEGKIAWIGVYDDLKNSAAYRNISGSISSVIDENSESDRSEDGLNDSDQESKTPVDVMLQELDVLAENCETHLLGSGDLIDEEVRESGTVKWSSYSQFVDAIGGIGVCFIILFLLVCAQLSIVFTTLWLASWASADSYEDQSDFGYIIVFTLLLVVTIIISIILAIFTFDKLVKGCKNLHDDMLSSMLRAPVLFFDSNPVGRILNRFSSDLGTIDDAFLVCMFDFLLYAGTSFSTAVLVIFVSPWVLAVFVPFSYLFYIIRDTYLIAGSEIRRIEAVRKSEIYSLMSETCCGLSTIRGFNDQSRFLEMMCEDINASSNAAFSIFSTLRWLAFNTDTLCALLLAVLAYSATLSYEHGLLIIDSSVLGYAVLSVIQLAAIFRWCIRQSAEVDTQMVCVERMLEYTNLLPEAPLHAREMHQVASDTIASPPPDSWPDKGRIVLSELSGRYRHNLPRVLKDVSLVIEPGHRIGVVGRTGSGKSSLISVLFRLFEPDSESSIVIDNISITSIGLHELRPRMSVIVQTPFLITGTVRDNLDPFEQYNDEQLWSCLDAAQMREAILALGSGLSADVSESGSNFSVGQKQLLCLARAILLKRKILIMDEATANIDTKTDGMIQSAVRRNFVGATVIMVAHRLLTVIDCDKILVLSKGKLLEYDHPHILLAKFIPPWQMKMYTTEECSKSSWPPVKATFAYMVEESGIEAADELRRLARMSYEIRRF